MGKYKKNNKQLNTLGKREKLTEAPDDLGFLTDDEIEEQERQEFEKRLAQRKAQRDTAKSQELDRQEQEKKKEQARKEAEAKGKELYAQVKNLPFEEWFDILVPRSGEAPTVAGEIVRAVTRLDYRYWNDGDMFYAGYGRETCGSSAAYLYEFEPFYELLIDMVYMSGSAYEQALNKLCDIAQDYLLDTPELFGTINEHDSRSDREYDINAISEFDEPHDFEYTVHLEDYYWTDPYGEDIYLKDYINNEQCTIWKVKDTFEDFYFDNRTGFYIERPWTHYDDKLELYNMDSHSYEQVKEYAEDVHLFDELIEELYNEFGDPNSEEDETKEESLKEELEAGDCVYHQGRDAYYYLKKHNDKSFELYEYRYGHLVEAHPFIIDIGSPFYKQLRLQTKRAMPNLKESWIQFTFEDGSNPYVAKTKEEQDRMFKKYKGRVEQVGDITYLVKSEKKKTNESLKESKTVIPEKANLKKILDRYESNGKFAKQGNWKIARGGYDLAFQLMYDDLALIDGIHSVWDDTTGLHLDVATYGANNEYNTNELANYICQVYTDCKLEGNLKEDTVKKGNKWVNKGNTGKTHGEFKTKKQADAQRKAMFVNKKKNSN